MPLILDTLPTHVAHVASRINAIGTEQSADSFLVTSYLAEAATKTLGVVLCGILELNAPDVAYRFGYQLVRADGLGQWDQVIREATSSPIAGYIPSDCRDLLVWLTKKRSGELEFAASLRSANEILGGLGLDPCGVRNAPTVRDLITALVCIRNKTKAHGALGPDFFAAHNEHYLAAVRGLVDHCPALAWDWLHLSIREKGTVRATHLRGSSPNHIKDAMAAQFRFKSNGIHFRPQDGTRLYSCGHLLFTDLECRDFFLPNGQYRSDGRAGFIDYASASEKAVNVGNYLTPPAPLPASETEGLPLCDIQGNVIGNLPDVRDGYIQRTDLQQQLEERLLDRNHTIVTLHGRGGIGKTSLAIYVAHRLAALDAVPFEQIAWFSARDVDLRPGGPVSVRPEVVSLSAIARHRAKLFGGESTEEALAAALRQPSSSSGKGTLFVFDNFETLDDMVGVQKFLDVHTHHPNKVLITSRERAFKADWPIEVRGMEFSEAIEMVKRTARMYGVEGLITNEVMRNVYESTDGHPYVMKVLVGEIAKEGRYVPVKQLVPRRDDIVQTVFERSFNKLSPSGKWVFLTVTNWRSPIYELAMYVVLAQYEVDVESGLDECQRLSLVLGDVLPDGDRIVWSPELARTFGVKKLQGEPDRLTIQAAIETLRRFGGSDREMAMRRGHDEMIRQFVGWARKAVEEKPASLIGIDQMFERVAGLWPKAWLDLAKFREFFGIERESVEYAYRRAVEEAPFSKAAWVGRAEYALICDDEATYIASLVAAVDSDPGDSGLVREVAFRLCQYIDGHKYDIPTARRGTYLASVRGHMVKIADLLDATGLSRLAWLFLLEGRSDEAKHYARLGLDRDPTNSHCLNILERP